MVDSLPVFSASSPFGDSAPPAPVSFPSTSVSFEELTASLQSPVVGFDLSVRSSAVAVVYPGSSVQDVVYRNFAVGSKDATHALALSRRALYRDMVEFFEGLGIPRFEHMVVEDIFQDVNPSTYRKLAVLNTVPDDVVLDDVVSCDSFHRVQNAVWKSALFKTLPTVSTNHLGDKERIEFVLNCLGVFESGKGSQDRLDALGLALYPVLVQAGIVPCRVKSSVSISDVSFQYVLNKEDLVLPEGYAVVDFKPKRVSQSSVISAVESVDVPSVFVSSRVSLGYKLVESLGVKALPFGGYLAFYVR